MEGQNWNKVNTACPCEFDTCFSLQQENVLLRYFIPVKCNVLNGEQCFVFIFTEN
jgi:hypothetical protein